MEMILFVILTMCVSSLFIIAISLPFSSGNLHVKTLPISIRKIQKDLAFIINFFTYANQLPLFKVPKIKLHFPFTLWFKREELFPKSSQLYSRLWIYQMSFHQLLSLPSLIFCNRFIQKTDFIIWILFIW